MFVKCMLAILCGMVMAQGVKLIGQDAEIFALRVRLDELTAEDEPEEYIAPIRRVNIMEFKLEEKD